MSTLTLSDEQEKRAKDILERVKEGEVTHPNDVLDKWEGCPSWSELDAMSGGMVFNEETDLSEEKWVPLTNVVGTDAELTDRFEEERIEGVLEMLLAGEFKPKYTSKPPKYIEVNGDYYVGSDGNHRTIVAKAVGLEELFADVTVIPVDESSSSEAESSPPSIEPQSNTPRTPTTFSDDRPVERESIGHRLRRWIKDLRGR